jgi:molybdopterin molybdotransferase
MEPPAPIELEEAQRLVVEGIASPGVESVPLRDALGRRLAEGVAGAGSPPPIEDLEDEDDFEEEDEDELEPRATELHAGAAIGARELAALGEAGLTSISCHGRPSVVVVTSGEELLEPEGPLRPGAVRNSNAYAIPVLAKLAGAHVRVAGPVPNEPKATRALIEPLLNADVVVFSGGVSVGKHDHVKHALIELGVQERFWGVSLEPGGSTWFGRRGDTLVLGLPPDPVSAAVSFTLLAQPALITLAGGPEQLRRRGVATLGNDYQKRSGPPAAVRCRLTRSHDGLYAYPTEKQDSRLLSSMFRVDCLALLPARAHLWQAGGWVEVAPLDPAWESVRWAPTDW